jgi:hypothetical protein
MLYKSLERLRIEYQFIDQKNHLIYILIRQLVYTVDLLFKGVVFHFFKANKLEK